MTKCVNLTNFDLCSAWRSRLLEDRLASLSMSCCYGRPGYVCLITVRIFVDRMQLRTGGESEPEYEHLASILLASSSDMASIFRPTSSADMASIPPVCTMMERQDWPFSIQPDSAFQATQFPARSSAADSI